MTLIELITYSAATWYIAYAVTSTHGPFGIFKKLREFKGGRWHGRTYEYDIRSSDPKVKMLQTDGLLDCIVCLSIWVAMALVLVTHHSILEGFAVAGVALWIHGYTGWRFGG